MIEKTSAYQTKDGQTFGTLEQAQQHALESLGFPAAVATDLLNNKDATIAILKLKPRKAKQKKAVKTPKSAPAKAA